jgi:hypothetical protein
MDQIRELKDNGGTKRLPCFFRLCLAVLCLCLAAHLFTRNSLAQEIKGADERIVTGAGTIVNGNIALARNEAISKGSLKAIEECLIQRLGSQGLANNFERLDEEILSRTKEHIRDYQIISEFRTDRYVKVLMKVRVNEATLEQRLEGMGLSETESIQIGVLFLVSEIREGFPPIYWWGDPSRQPSLTHTELALSRVFEDRGFRVVSRSFFPPEESYDKGMLNLTLGNEQAVKWGKLLSAEVVIIGEAYLYGASRASVFLKALKVMDGAVLVQGYREGTLVGDQSGDGSAVELAVDSWVNDMLSHLVKGLKPAEKPISQVTVMIKGLESYKELRDFNEFLRRDFPEVRSAVETSLKRDVVRVCVEVKGDPAELAEKVLNHPKRPFSFEIDELSDQGFTVVIR